MKTNNIQQSLLEGLESRIKYQYSMRMIILVIIYMLLAVGAVVLLMTANIDQRSPLYFVLGLVAFLGVLLSVSTFVFSKKEIVLSDTGVKLLCNTYYFDASIAIVNDDISNHRFEHLKSLLNNVDRGIRLDLLYSEDASEGRYRLYKYVPFEYQPISDIVSVDTKGIEMLLKM